MSVGVPLLLAAVLLLPFVAAPRATLVGRPSLVLFERVRAVGAAAAACAAELPGGCSMLASRSRCTMVLRIVSVTGRPAARS